MRIAAPERQCIGYTVDGRRYDTDRTGHLDVPDKVAKALVAEGGAFVPGVSMTKTRTTWICPACGSHRFFNRCGRCGVPCTKE